METRRRVVSRLPLILALLASPMALAWDGAITGPVGQFDVTSGANYGFRVSLVAFPALCGNANNWAYLNSSESNYETYVAAIMLARAQGLEVTIYSDRDAQGYCHIGYLAVRYP
jgi:hypothetical protein